MTLMFLPQKVNFYPLSLCWTCNFTQIQVLGYKVIFLILILFKNSIISRPTWSRTISASFRRNHVLLFQQRQFYVSNRAQISFQFFQWLFQLRDIWPFLAIEFTINRHQTAVINSSQNLWICLWFCMTCALTYIFNNLYIFVYYHFNCF